MEIINIFVHIQHTNLSFINYYFYIIIYYMETIISL